MKSKKSIEFFEMGLGCGLYVKHFLIIKIVISLFLKQEIQKNTEK